MGRAEEIVLAYLGECFVLRAQSSENHINQARALLNAQFCVLSKA